MTFSDVHNGGATGRSARAGGNTAITAGGSGDATEVNGSWISRKNTPKGLAMSAKLVVSYSVTLAQGATLAFAANFQDASDISGTGAADFGELYPETVVATGGTGGSTEVGTFELDVDLGGAREFIRAQFTPNLSAANTDAGTIQPVYLLYGDQRGLSTKSTVNLASADAI